jgi:hypothetical protein
MNEFQDASPPDVTRITLFGTRYVGGIVSFAGRVILPGRKGSPKVNNDAEFWLPTNLILKSKPQGGRLGARVEGVERETPFECFMYRTDWYHGVFTTVNMREALDWSHETYKTPKFSW